MCCCLSTIHNCFDCFFFVNKSSVALFLVYLLGQIYVFSDFKDILMQLFTNFYDLILLLYVFHLTTISHHYLILFLHHIFHMFLCLYQPYLYNVFHRWHRIFNFILFYSLNTLYLHQK